jgi:hypothetical protein
MFKGAQDVPGALSAVVGIGHIVCLVFNGARARLGASLLVFYSATAFS